MAPSLISKITRADKNSFKTLPKGITKGANRIELKKKRTYTYKMRYGAEFDAFLEEEPLREDSELQATYSGNGGTSATDTRNDGPRPSTPLPQGWIKIWKPAPKPEDMEIDEAGELEAYYVKRDGDYWNDWVDLGSTESWKCIGFYQGTGQPIMAPLCHPAPPIEYDLEHINTLAVEFAKANKAGKGNKMEGVMFGVKSNEHTMADSLGISQTDDMGNVFAPPGCSTDLPPD